MVQLVRILASIHVAVTYLKVFLFSVKQVSNKFFKSLEETLAQDKVKQTKERGFKQINVAGMTKAGDGCSQNDLQNLIRLFGKLEARHIFRVLDRTKLFKVGYRKTAFLYKLASVASYILLRFLI